MRVTAVVNSKGGSGKTTTALNLAAAAALDGKRVLLVDMDKQGSATQWLGHSPDNDGLVKALLGEVPLSSLVVETSVERFGLVPASVAVQHDRITSETGYQYLLREALSKVGPWDWVIVDAPGDLGPSTIITLTAATDVLIPIPAGGMELDEVPKVKEAIAKVKSRLNPDLEVAGVLLTKVNVYGRNISVLAREVREQLRRDFPGRVLETFVRDDMRFREAPAARQPIAIYDPGGKGEADYRAVLDELREREVISVG